MGTCSRRISRQRGPTLAGTARLARSPAASTGVVSLRPAARARACSSTAIARAGRARAGSTGSTAASTRSGTRRSRPTGALTSRRCSRAARTRSLSHRAAGGLHGLARSRPRSRSPAPRGRQADARASSSTAPRPAPTRTAPSSTASRSPAVARTLVDLADVLQRAPARRRRRTRPRSSASSTSRAVERASGAPAGPPRAPRASGASSPPTGPSRAYRATRPSAGFLRLCADHGLPRPQFNVRVAGYEVDFYWPEARLALELDGAATHHTPPRIPRGPPPGPRAGRRRHPGRCASPGADLAERPLARPGAAAIAPGAAASSTAVPEFRVNSAYTPVADQEQARAALAEGIDGGRPLPDPARASPAPARRRRWRSRSSRSSGRRS